MLRQSQGIQEPAQRRQGVLRFVGLQADLGQYSTFVSDCKIQEDISISVKVPVYLPESDIKLFHLLRQDSAKNELIPPDRPLPSSGPLFLKIDFKFKGHQAKSNMPEAEVQGLLETAKYSIIDKSGVIFAWDVTYSEDEILMSESSGFVQPSVGMAQTEEAMYVLTVPSRYFEEVGGKRLMQPFSEDEHNLRLIVVLDGLLPTKIVAKFLLKKGKPADDWSIFPLPPAIDRLTDQFKAALSAIHYIAPLRAPAKRFYITQYDALPNLDPTGEFLPYLFARQREPEVVHVLPKQTTPIKQGLYAALDAWMHYLRTGEFKPEPLPFREVIVSSLRGVLVELQIPTPQGTGTHSLADSGFGYSQVLPILVRGLLSSERSTIIIEQPELHLNPALQVRLAEFFVALVLAGKQVILETHSEHIVNTIRVLIAEQDLPQLTGNSNIYYLECSPTGPLLHDLAIRSDGSVPDWPREFFGEAAELVARLLRAQKRHKVSD
jgi:hypothetical protein